MLCACGCGQQTQLSKNRIHGYEVGDSLRYVAGHNSRWVKNRDLKSRLLEKRNVEGDCWLWTGQLDRRGYGRMSFDGRKQFVHNLSYRLFRGPIPQGMEPDHLCRTRACFNPDHLEAVTQAENTRRGKQAKLTHAQILEIRESKEPHTVTAERYGVHPSTICDIRNFRRWNYEGRSS